MPPRESPGTTDGDHLESPSNTRAPEQSRRRHRVDDVFGRIADDLANLQGSEEEVALRIQAAKTGELRILNKDVNAGLALLTAAGFDLRCSWMRIFLGQNITTPSVGALAALLTIYDAVGETPPAVDLVEWAHTSLRLGNLDEALLAYRRAGATPEPERLTAYAEQAKAEGRDAEAEVALLLVRTLRSASTG